MITRRRTPDLSRMREAIEGPGIDTRVWTSRARVDDDPDAIRWDENLGWLVDVTFVSGPLDGEGSIVCRVASPYQGDGVGIARPPLRGGLVQVEIPAGNINVEPTITGYLHDNQAKPPTKVNGTDITEAMALETHITVAPGHDLDEQWRNIRMTADLIQLAVANPEQSFIRGDALLDRLEPLLDAFFQWATAATADIGGAATTAAYNSTLVPAKTAFDGASSTYRSTKIKGD